MKKIALAAVYTVVLTCSHAQANGWKASEDNTEATATGCSAASDFEFLCLEVRCTGGKEITLHGLMTGEILDGKFELRVDDRRFPVEGTEPALVNASSRSTLVGETLAIVEAMKQGNKLLVHYPDMGLDPEFAKISLRGSARAIRHVEGACAPPDADGPANAGLLHNASGRVAIEELHDTPGCASAEGRGTVDSVERDGPSGAISGIWFVDDTYGREFINVDTLKPTRDIKARQATLDYLLTAGRRLAIDVHGCGAAGRIQKLVSAAEHP